MVKEELAEVMQKKLPLFPFKLFFGQTQLALYSIRQDERTKWVKAMKEAIGYANLSDFYDMKVNAV